MEKSFGKLDPLFKPRSIAVIGASPKGGAGSIVINNLHRLGYTGTIHPINPKYKEVLGHPCYPSLRDLPVQVDCAAVLISSASLLPMLEEAAAVGVKGAWGLAGGFAESGKDGRTMQRRIRDFCRDSGLLFCGPNCVGYANLTDRVCMYSAPLPKRFRPGNIGVIAQSGAVLLALGNADREVGFSRLISSGNEASLGLAEYMDDLIDDDATDVIALFAETIRDAENFASACRRASAKGKPVVALKVGRSELARRVAATHTGAVAGSDRMLDAFFRRLNVIRVNTLDDLLETAVLLGALRDRPATSGRVGMATVSGGEMGMLADICVDNGLEFPPLSPDGEKKLRAVLPPYAPIANPLDAWGSGNLSEAYPASLGILAAEPDVETVIVSQDMPGNMAPEQAEQSAAVARAAAAAHAASGKPVIVVSNIAGGLDPDVRAVLDQGRVPVVQGSGAAIRAIRGWMDWSARRAAGPGPEDENPASFALPPELSSLVDACTGVLPHAVAARLLRYFGISTDGEILAVTREEGKDAARRLGYPVALKVASPDILHRTEHGLVKLNLHNEAALIAAWETLEEILHTRHAGVRREGMLVQSMVRSVRGDPADVVETIIGANRDDRFGTAVMVGLGGIFVELLRDVSLEPVPICFADALAMIRRLKGAKLLTGFRGRPAADVNALADLLVRVSTMSRALGNRLVSLDLNPVMVLPEGEGVRLADVVIQVAPARDRRENDQLLEENIR